MKDTLDSTSEADEYSFGDEQTQPYPLDTSLGAEEGVEQPIQIFIGNPRTIIGKGNPDMAIEPIGGNGQ